MPKEYETHALVLDSARPHGVAENTIYRWKYKFAGLSVSKTKRLRAHEQKKAGLKRLLAKAELDKAALRGLRKKNSDGRIAKPGGSNRRAYRAY